MCIIARLSLQYINRTVELILIMLAVDIPLPKRGTRDMHPVAVNGFDLSLSMMRERERERMVRAQLI